MSASWDHEVDVVCVGSGIGGCGAAIAAADAGLRTLLVEKTERLGGVTAYSGGQIWVPGNRHGLAQGIADSAEEGIAYVDALREGWGDAKLTRNLFENANGALNFFEDHGFRVHLIPQIPDYFYPAAAGAKEDGRYLEPDLFDLSTLGEWREKLRRTPRPGDQGGLGRNVDASTFGPENIGGGEAVAAYFVRGAANAGVEFWLKSPVIDLITESDRVVGVLVRTPTGDRRVKAVRGVVLATGGYDWNKDLVHRFEGGFENHASLAPPGVEGDHLVMGGAIGASITTIPAQRGVMMLGFPTGAYDDEGKPTALMYLPTGQHEMIVNRAGERFADESFYPSLHTGIHALSGKSHEQNNWPVWLIFDRDYMESDLRRLYGAPGEAFRISADSLEGLAERAGIDPAGLKQSVERYNQLSEIGRDEDFGLGEVLWVKATRSHSPGGADSPIIPKPIARAPFYAAQMSRLQVGVGVAGLETNENCQVVRLTGRPIDGLYAVGNAAGRHDIGICLHSGIANLRGMVYGYLAGRHLAQRN